MSTQFSLAKVEKTHHMYFTTNLKNLQEYLKITIKQHYIPKVYLRHFKIKNLEEKEEKILV